MALSPHPDDVELFCAGTLLVAADAGCSTAVVDMTEGELSTNGDPGRRATEREAASELLGLHTRVSLGLPDGAVGSDPGHRAALVETIRTLAPAVLLAPHRHDRHPDHAATGRLAREAAFLAGAAARPGRVYWYMLHHLFLPSLVVDVSPVWERRCRLFDVYASQVSPNGAVPTAINDGGFLAMLRARAAHFGGIAGVAYAEGFQVEGPLLVDSLPGAPAGTEVAAGRYRAYL